MNCVIIDDEKHSAELLENLLLNRWPEIEILGRATGLSDAVEMIRRFNPDLIFLDIEIQGGTGFDVLDVIDIQNTKVVFCTGYNEFAIRAFKYNALDYLLKPISVAEFDQAVNKAKNAINQEIALQNLMENNTITEPPCLVITDRNRYTRLDLNNILRARAEGAYTRFELRDGKEYLTSHSLGYYQEILPENRFARVHHSALINLACILDFDFAIGTLTLENGIVQEVSVRKRKAVRDLLAGK